MMKKDWVFEQYVKEISKPKLQPDEFYWENGKLVLTEVYHKRRGSCCGNNCRHCPYNPKSQKGNINI